MVESSMSFFLCTLSLFVILDPAQARASDFVGKTAGKLRDYYRIGKILGTGKKTLQTLFIDVIDLSESILLSGAFGEVRMCVHRESGAQRAVKVLRKSHMDEDEKRMLFNEINILKEIVSNLPTRNKFQMK